MKVVASLVLALGLALPIFAQPAAVKKTPPSFQDVLSQATLAVYEGRVVCTPDSCDLKSSFICTATVVGGDSLFEYTGLTAGHCFEDQQNPGLHYYVSETVNQKPVLRKIDLVKSDNSSRYDYGLFTFSSARDYPTIPVDLSSVPQIGMKILNANFSLGVTKEIVEGTVVSGIVGESAHETDLRRRYFAQIVFGPGASGSPIVDEQTHKIIGIVEAMFPGTQMAAVVMPVGTNYADFLEDDSVVPQNVLPDPFAGDTKSKKLAQTKRFFKVSPEALVALWSSLIIFGGPSIVLLVFFLGTRNIFKVKK